MIVYTKYFRVSSNNGVTDDFLGFSDRIETLLVSESGFIRLKRLI